MSEAPTHRHAIELRPSWAFFEGHFPGRPIAPGAAQLTALVQPQIRERWPQLGEPRAVRRLKFLHELRPGDRLLLTLERQIKHPAHVRFRLSRGETVCSTGELRYAPQTPQEASV